MSLNANQQAAANKAEVQAANKARARAAAMERNQTASMWDQVRDVNSRYNDSEIANFQSRDYGISLEDWHQPNRNRRARAPEGAFSSDSASREIQQILAGAGITDATGLMTAVPGSHNDTYADLGIGNSLYGNALRPEGGGSRRPIGGAGGFATYGNSTGPNGPREYDASGIGQSTLTERGKKESIWGNPVFDVLAAAAAPFTGGLSLAAQKALQAATGDTLKTGDYLEAGAAVGGGMLGLGGQSATAGDAFAAGGREAYEQSRESSNNTPISDDIDPNETGPMIGNTPVNSRPGWHWEKDPEGISGWKAVRDVLQEDDGGGGGSAPASGGAPATGGGGGVPQEGDQVDPNHATRDDEQWRHTNPDGTTVAGNEMGEVWEVAPENIAEGDGDLEGDLDTIFSGYDPQAEYDGLTLGGMVDPAYEGVGDTTGTAPSTGGGGTSTESELSLGGGLGPGGSLDDGSDGSGGGDGGDGDGSGDGGFSASGMMAGLGTFTPNMLDLFKMPEFKKLPPMEQWLAMAQKKREEAMNDVS